MLCGSAGHEGVLPWELRRPAVTTVVPKPFGLPINHGGSWGADFGSHLSWPWGSEERGDHVASLSPC